MKPVNHLCKILTFAVLVVAFTATSAHAYNNSQLIDDPVFDNVGSMNEAQVQSFLTARGPCLKSYNDIDFNWNGSAWTYGGSIPASKIIYKAAQQWGLNPQVILATLQKESSLVSGTACDGWRYTSAMGYDCPDSGSCNPKFAGLSRQVLWGSWQLKFNKERSLGNTAWDGDDNITYVGFMTQGVRKRCGGCASHYYSGDATVDGQVLHLNNGATASLYTYTPHLGQSFPGLFESFFGVGSTAAYPPNAVFRSVNTRTGEHFLTINPNEWNATIAAGFRREGIGFLQSTGSGVVNVWRLLKKDGKHFFTANYTEAQHAAANYGFKIEGRAFTMRSAPGPGLIAVWRLRNGANNDHLYTSSIAERDAARSKYGYVLEGVAWYAN